MYNWKKYKLGEVVSIKYGKDHKNLNDGPYPVYGSGGIMRYVDKYLYNKESVLIPRKGSLNNIFYRDNAFWTVDTMFWSEINTERVFPKFLYYQLSLVDFENLNVGSAVPSLTIPIINDVDVSLPSLDEQKRIAGVLSSLDDKIDLLNRENSTLEALAETLFRHYFIENPNPEWKEMPVSYYGKVICGKTPSKKNEEYYGGEVPFIKIPDMHGKTYVFNSEDTLSEKGKALQKEKTLPANSIMVSCIATVGLVSMNAIESQTNQQINSVVPNNEQYRYYLYCWFKLMYDELNTMASGGTATLNLNTGDFSRMGIPLPDDDAIKEFHLRVKPIFSKIKSNQQQIHTLSTQRDILLHSLMGGVVKVK